MCNGCTQEWVASGGNHVQNWLSDVLDPPETLAIERGGLTRGLRA